MLDRLACGTRYSTASWIFQSGRSADGLVGYHGSHLPSSNGYYGYLQLVFPLGSVSDIKDPVPSHCFSPFFFPKQPLKPNPTPSIPFSFSNPQNTLTMKSFSPVAMALLAAAGMVAAADVTASQCAVCCLAVICHSKPLSLVTNIVSIVHVYRQHERQGL